MRLVLSTALEIIAKLFDDGAAERELLGFGKLLAKARVVRSRLRRNRLHDGDEFFPQFRKQRPNRRRLHSEIGEINQRVGNVVVTGKIVRQLATVFEGLFQVRTHGRKIVGGPRLHPGFVGGGLVCTEFRDECGRNFHCAVVIAPRDADQGGLVGIGGQRSAARL